MKFPSAAFAFLAIALFLSNYAYSTCPTAKRDIYLAAVTGENEGGIFQLEVETRPGKGSIYTAVSPRIGFATQESEELAARVAAETAGIDLSECDVFFRINGDFGDSSVDGPSAGGAMAVATRAALLNQSIRQDIVMTGTISPEGKVGEVGGIIEKSLAASDAGAKYILVPKLKIYEMLLLSSVSRTKDFRVIEVSNLTEAEKVIFSNYSQNFTALFAPKSLPMPSTLQPIEMDFDLARFGIVARGVVEELDSKAGSALMGSAGAEKIAGVKEYFRSEVNKYYAMLSMGYPFTAANSAFLLSIDAEYLKIGGTKVDMTGSIEDVSSCLDSLSKPNKTVENFHWAVGSDLRRNWAKKKFNETLAMRGEQTGYTTLRDLLFSYSWCGISRELAVQANDIGGKPVEEAALAPLSSKKLLEAEEALASSDRPDYDALWHLQAGLDANESGDFGAAIYEATYAMTMQGVTSESEKNLTEAAQKLSQGGRESLWGKIYYGHGMYLYAEAKEGGFIPADAYRILEYSSDLDKASAEINQELLKKPTESSPIQPPAQEEVPSGQQEQDTLLSVFLALCVAVLGFVVIWRLIGGIRK